MSINFPSTWRGPVLNSANNNSGETQTPLLGVSSTVKHGFKLKVLHRENHYARPGWSAAVKRAID